MSAAGTEGAGSEGADSTYSWSGMRISDRERQRAIDELRRHCAAGRLDVDEYSIRIEQAMAASTLEELDRLLADLPMMRIADPEPRIRPGVTMPSRVTAMAIVILAVVLVVTAVVLTLLLSWAWAAVLLTGWLVGIVQSRLRAARSERQ